MATCPVPCATTVNHHNRRSSPPSNYNCSATQINDAITFCSSSLSKVNLHRSFPLKRSFRLGHCRASTSPSEPTPEKDPPPDSASGVTPKDTLQIFFAVLFWMSLFFWSCAWDGGNNGKPNKGSRFRK